MKRSPLLLRIRMVLGSIVNHNAGYPDITYRLSQFLQLNAWIAPQIRPHTLQFIIR
jgi:hypothetical protein